MPGAGKEEKKPEQDERIILKVKNQVGDEVFFSITRGTQLKKLMNAYCDSQSVDYYSVRFLLDGCRFNDEQTPAELELEDDDEIYVVQGQVGG